jgi:hypothetical protein
MQTTKGVLDYATSLGVSFHLTGMVGISGKLVQSKGYCKASCISKGIARCEIY